MKSAVVCALLLTFAACYEAAVTNKMTPGVVLNSVNSILSSCGKYVREQTYVYVEIWCTQLTITLCIIIADSHYTVMKLDYGHVVVSPAKPKKGENLNFTANYTLSKLVINKL